MKLEDFANFLGQSQPVTRLAVTVFALVVTAVVYKLFSRSISNVGKRLELDEHVQNSLRLVLRVLTILVAITTVFTAHELPTTWFVGSSALVGAAIGFGSSQTINNIAAGFYVIVNRPFRAKDYVMIDEQEGQVEEITINYTKLYTPSFNILEIPNVQVLNSRILNCTHEGYIKYTFSLGLPHLGSNEDFAKCTESAIEEFSVKHREKQLRRPEYYFETSTGTGRSFKLRIFVPRGDARTLYVLQPELSDMIMRRWDAIRSKREKSKKQPQNYDLGVGVR